MKICNWCKENKSYSEFYKNQMGAGGLRAECKSCTNMRQAAARFGITEKELLAMYETQNHSCKICGKVRPLVIDHDHNCCAYHETKKSRSCGKCVRGLLCAKCNHGLGKFDDSPELLRAAIDYLGA